LAESSHRSTAAIQADIDEVTQRLRDLKTEAEAGFEVGMATDRAQEELKALQNELRLTGIAAEAAANNAAGAFDAMLNSMDGANAAASNPLPTVHRYGGDPNQIDLPSKSSTYNSNANGSGVGVRSFGGDPTARDTADNTEDTADNVDRLDTNTKGYISRLSDDIGQYSAQQTQQQNIVINKLSDVTAQTFGLLSQSILAALVHNNDSGATGTGKTMFGDAFDPSVGSYVSDWGITKMAPRTFGYDNLTKDTSVQVAQPGTNISLTYYAAAGESTATAQQRARDMYDELVRGSGEVVMVDTVAINNKFALDMTMGPVFQTTVIPAHGRLRGQEPGLASGALAL
jgi:hypothetical protein